MHGERGKPRALLCAGMLGMHPPPTRVERNETNF